MKRPMSKANMADWRRWAIFDALARPAQHPLKVSDLVRVLVDEGWADVLPASGHYDAVQRALLSMKKNGDALRTGRPARWALTVVGRDFAYEFVVDNPNITPAQMLAER